MISIPIAFRRHHLYVLFPKSSKTVAKFISLVLETLILDSLFRIWKPLMCFWRRVREFFSPIRRYESPGGYQDARRLASSCTLLPLAPLAVTPPVIGLLRYI